MSKVLSFTDENKRKSYSRYSRRIDRYSRWKLPTMEQTQCDGGGDRRDLFDTKKTGVSYA